MNQHPLELELQKGGDVQFAAIGVLFAFCAKMSFFSSVADQSLQVRIDCVMAGDERESNSSSAGITVNQGLPTLCFKDHMDRPQAGSKISKALSKIDFSFLLPCFCNHSPKMTIS